MPEAVALPSRRSRKWRQIEVRATLNRVFAHPPRVPLSYGAVMRIFEAVELLRQIKSCDGDMFAAGTKRNTEAQLHEIVARLADDAPLDDQFSVNVSLWRANIQQFARYQSAEE